MKKQSIVQLFIAMMLCWHTLPNHAQFISATTPDQSIAGAGTAPSVTRTNISHVELPLGGTPLTVMVWDGPSAKFGWDYGGTTGFAPIGVGAVGTPYRADIVTNPNATAGTEKVLIVYQTGFNRMYYEVHQWVAGTFVNVVPATLIAGGTGSSVDHSNVDVFANGRAVLTWSEDGSVYGKGFNFASNTLSASTFNASACSGSTNCGRGDVAVFRPTTGGNRVNFVFVANYGSTERLFVQRATFSQVWSGAAATCSGGWTNVLDNVNLADQQFGIPRIACPNQFIGFMDLLDASVVCLKQTTSPFSYDIVNYTHHRMAYGPNVFVPHSLNTSPEDISKCFNKYPSVSYVGRFIIATWTHRECTGATGLEGFDIVARQMNVDGVPWSLFGTYSIVNQGIAGTQSNSGIDGKFSLDYIGHYVWADKSSLGVEYKRSYFYNQSLREATIQETAEASNAEIVGLQAFPNPITDEVVFTFELNQGEQANGLEIYDLTGRLMDQVSLTGLTANTNRIDWQVPGDLPAGVYLVNLLTDQRLSTVRITRQ